MRILLEYTSLLAILCVTAITSASGGDEQIKPRWQPHDFVFQAQAREGNPFTVPFAARVTRPDGSEFTTQGFFDGGGAWKIRISPDAEGPWRLVTQSTVKDLDGKTAEFVCGANPNPQIHGALKVDKAHPHHFVYEDGARCFPMGYECDWLWALDTNDPTLKTINSFIDKLAASGFNFIILNTYAHDCGWRKGRTGPDDYGPPPLYAWAGTNERPDHTRFNLAYWQHYDRVIEALYRRGITAHILIKVYNKQVKWPAIGSPEDDQFFRWVIARYAAYPQRGVGFFQGGAHREKSRL